MAGVSGAVAVPFVGAALGLLALALFLGGHRGRAVTV